MLRSLLYVPADQPQMLAKAGERGADLVLIDLEGPAADKQEARRQAVAAIIRLKGQGAAVGVRVNSQPGELEDDLSALATLEYLEGAGVGLDIACVPQANLAAIEHMGGALAETGLAALIETGRGLLDAPILAAHPRVVRLAIGEAHLTADLGMSDPEEADWSPARSQLVWASAAAGLPGPIGPAYPDIADLEGLARSTARLAAQGFTGRAAVHPSQVPVINRVFTPTADQLAAARRLVEDYDSAAEDGRGVVTDEQGRIVNLAVVRRWRRLLSGSE